MLFSVCARMEIPQPLFSLISPVGKISRNLHVHPPLDFPSLFYIWFRPDKYMLGNSIWVFGLEPQVRNSWEVWNCFQKSLHFQQGFPFHNPMGWDGWKTDTDTILSTPFLCLIISQQSKHWVMAVEGRTRLRIWHLLISQCHQVEHFPPPMDVWRKVTHRDEVCSQYLGL